jgi:hypothetical protein
MSNQKSDKNDYLRLAFKFFEKEKSPAQILKLIPRSRSWLFKWKQRFRQHGWQALKEFSHKPLHSPQGYRKATRQLVLKLRAKMQTAAVGLHGAQAIRDHLLEHKLVKRVPSLPTIKRWLREGGCFQAPDSLKPVPYYPRLKFPPQLRIASVDWISRYLRGGEKVFAFHTLDLKTHALCQSLETCKTTEVACSHLLKSLSEFGQIDFLQLDNDAAFTGLGRKSRIFGQFVRMALYFGIELVFIPPGEPKRNSQVERVNGLWASAFWNRNHFSSVGEVKKKSPRFLKWYLGYRPPSLAGKSVREASTRQQARPVSRKEIGKLPQFLPLTEGRIHYYRRVDERGQIEILKEKFRVSKSLRGEYVLATIDLKEQTLTVYYCRSERSKAKVVKKFDYEIEEKVVKLKARYRRGRNRRVEILEII